jgi:hypothetical protein
MPPASETTKVIRPELERACKEFTDRIEVLGFSRTKNMIWSRLNEFTADFIHLHRCGSTYGAPLNYSVRIRVGYGVRILNDPRPSLALNGPGLTADVMRKGRYHLRFNAKTGSTFDRCVEDLVRITQEELEPWFTQYRTPENLLETNDTTLNAECKALLKAACEKCAFPENVALSLKLLGIKNKKVEPTSGENGSRPAAKSFPI